jgi:6-phosphogluconolactonase (cycloisomerase 2 family)
MQQIEQRLGILVLLGLSACGGGGGGGGGGAPQPAERSNLGYVVNPNDSTISIYDQDSTSGALGQLAYMPMPMGQSGPEKAIVHPNGTFAYVPNMGTSNLSVFTIDGVTGMLAPGIALALGSGPHSGVIDPKGKFLYVTSQGSDQLHVFSIDPSTGALSFVQAIPTGRAPAGCAVDRLDRFVFVALRGDASNLSAWQTYPMDATTGELGAPTAAPLQLGHFTPNAIVVDPMRNNFYTTSERFDYVIPVSYDATTGALTGRTARLTRGASDPAAMPVALAIDHAGRFVYAANQTAGTVACFAVTDPTTGSLSGSTVVAAGAGASALAYDPDGKFLYVLGSVSQTLDKFTIDPLTGVVAASDSVVTRAAPGGLGFASPSPSRKLVAKFLHVAASDSNEAPAYAIAPATGALTEVASPAGTNNHPVSAASDSLHRFLYVASQTSATIDAFTIDPSTGALGSIGSPAPTLGTPTHVVVDPSARFLYVTTRDVVNANDGWVTTWSIDQLDGSVTALDTHQLTDVNNALNAAVWAACDPTGSFLYVATKSTIAGGNRIWLLAIDPVDGSLMLSANAPAVAPGVSALGYHPKKRVLYAIAGSANAVYSFAANATTGELAIIAPGGSASCPGTPSAIAISPNGKFAYVANLDPASTGHVSAFSLNPANGKLVPPSTPYTDGLGPIDLAMDGNGEFVYVANSRSNDVSVFQANPVDGTLVAKTSAMSGLEPSAVVVTTVRQ